MTRSLRFYILIPFLLGLAAGIFGLLDAVSPETLDFALSHRGKLAALLIGGAGLAGVVMWKPGTGRKPRRDRERYEKPTVTGAAVSIGNIGRGAEWLGELTVSAARGDDVGKDIRLPPGSRISAIERNQLYKVLIPNTSVEQVEAIAREHGFGGNVSRS